MKPGDTVLAKVLQQKDNTFSLRVSIPMPSTAGQEVIVPYGGTYYGLISADGVISMHIGEDPFFVAPVGIIRIMPEGVTFGKDNRQLKIKSSIASDVVTIAIGYGAEIPLDVLLNGGISVKPSPAVEVAQVLIAPPTATETLLVPGDYKYLVLNISQPTSGDFEIQMLDQSGVNMGPPVGSPLPGWPIYYPDGSVFGNLNNTYTFPVFNSNFTLIIPLGGASEVLFKNIGAGAYTQISGQFTNSEF